MKIETSCDFHPPHAPPCGRNTNRGIADAWLRAPSARAHDVPEGSLGKAEQPISSSQAAQTAFAVRYGLHCFNESRGCWLADWLIHCLFVLCLLCFAFVFSQRRWSPPVMLRVWAFPSSKTIGSVHFVVFECGVLFEKKMRCTCVCVVVRKSATFQASMSFLRLKTLEGYFPIFRKVRNIRDLKGG